ncbi:MAG: PAS domain S-box protein [Candidatus Thorarchaeota archaeon]
MGFENDRVKGKNDFFSIEESIYETLFKNFPDLILILDLRGTIINISETIIDLYGVQKKEDCIGKNLLELVVPEEQDSLKQTIQRVLSKGSVRMVEHKLKKKDGTTFIGELSLSILKDKNEENKYLICILRDITNQKEIEDKLRESQAMFQLVMDNIPQFISWKDKNSVYIGCNKNFARVAGVDEPYDIIGKTDYDLPWKISEAESFFEIDQLVMDTDKPEYHIIEPQLQADGKKAWLDTNKIPLHDSKARVVGLLCTYEDITDRVNSEKALTDSERKYRDAYNRAEFYKDIFAHDISNILQNILSSVELSQFHLQKAEKNKELKQIFEIIKEQIIRGANLVSNVRKLSILDETSPNLNNIEVFEFLNKSKKYINVEFPERKINIQFSSPFESYFVKANNLLLDVFNNLLYNAVKHNNNEVANVLIRASETQKNLKNYLKLEFIDNGLGIPDEQKNVIFQLEEWSVNNFSRIGLGLSLVKKIMSTFEGQIFVEDKVKGNFSKGSNFILLIPKALN